MVLSLVACAENVDRTDSPVDENQHNQEIIESPTPSSMELLYQTVM